MKLCQDHEGILFKYFCCCWWINQHCHKTVHCCHANTWDKIFADFRDDMCMRHLCTVTAVHVCDVVRVKGRLQTVLVGYLWMNQVECISDTLWQRAAGHTAGGGTSLQVTSGRQEAAIVLLHTSWTIHVVNNCSNTCFNICQRCKSIDTFKKKTKHMLPSITYNQYQI